MSHVRFGLLVSLFATTAILSVAPPVAHPLQRLTAQKVVEKAIADARSQHKVVLLIFGASWCSWCHVLDAFMKTEGAAAVFQSDFVVVNLDVQEDASHADLDTPGGDALMNRYGGSESLPFLVMLDGSGQLIANSDRTGKPDSNIGYPVQPEEVAWFVHMMHQALPTLSGAELMQFQEQLSGFNRKNGLH